MSMSNDELRARLRRLQDREVPFCIVTVGKGWAGQKPRIMSQWTRSEGR
jgi:hypothetical protein